MRVKDEGLFPRTLRWTVGLTLLLASACGDSAASLELQPAVSAGGAFPLEGFDSARTNVVFLFAPGRECVSCLRVAEKWRAVLEGWPEAKVRVGYVLVARAETAKTWAPRLQKGVGTVQVWVDPENLFRRRFGLESGPVVVGVTARGRIKFSVPMTQEFWSRIAYPEEFIECLMRESLKP